MGLVAAHVLQPWGCPHPLAAAAWAHGAALAAAPSTQPLQALQPGVAKRQQQPRGMGHWGGQRGVC